MQMSFPIQQQLYTGNFQGSENVLFIRQESSPGRCVISANEMEFFFFSVFCKSSWVCLFEHFHAAETAGVKKEKRGKAEKGGGRQEKKNPEGWCKYSSSFTQK